jgi:hypothetical protein
MEKAGDIKRKRKAGLTKRKNSKKGIEKTVKARKITTALSI